MKRQLRVLLAEDEASLGSILKETLEDRGMTVTHCLDGESALQLFHSEVPDILVLDVMMPKIDGFTVASEIRKTNREVPILFLTAKTQTKDVVAGFKLGGNDYLKKPFSLEELIVRILALGMKLEEETDKKLISIGNYSFNHIKQQLNLGDYSITLTHRESELLYFLCVNRNAILKRDYILKKLWGESDFFTARSMDVYISKLRKKLKEDPSVEIINVRGIGYKLIC